MNFTPINGSSITQRQVVLFFQNKAPNFEQRLEALCKQTRILKQENSHSAVFNEKIRAWSIEARNLICMHSIFRLDTARIFQAQIEKKLPKLVDEEARLRAALVSILPEGNNYDENLPLSSFLFDCDDYLKNLEAKIDIYETGLGSLNVVLPYILDPNTLFSRVDPDKLNELAENMKHYWHSSFYCL